MAALISCLLIIIASLLAIPVTIFLLEIVAAIALSQAQSTIGRKLAARPRIAVLVPAHNESSGLLPTLTNIQAQLHPHDRLLVVADNCSDDTAAVAGASGAEIVERHDPIKRGKGYALDWGVRHLSSNPPKMIIIIDADCKLADGAIDNLAHDCAVTGRPVQALYLMTTPIAVNGQAAEFALRVKNWLRPLGLRALNLPCQLMGTGMAFPWDSISSVELATGQIVEDLKLGLDLALAGNPPLYCPAARVMSEFASSAKGARTQRQRWEQGHLQIILNAAPRLITTAFARRNWNLLAMALDVSVPPLSLLAILVFGSFCASSLFGLSGGSLGALYVNSVSLLAFATATFLAWYKMRSRHHSSWLTNADTLLCPSETHSLLSTCIRLDRFAVDEDRSNEITIRLSLFRGRLFFACLIPIPPRSSLPRSP
jgi:cellulose synthase/poly-beta-1,6-N-acetylglucosamine synthase-like glycosyltransferase